MFWKGVLWNALVRDHLPVLRTHQMPTAGRAAFAVYHRDRGVLFLVEGLSVDVPQTLLDQFPDTKLAKLAMGSQAKDDEPIAIDVDLLHFRYMVEYMRRGEVTLAHPGIIDKESLMTTLDSFGFQDTSDLMVVNPGTSLGLAIVHAKKHLEVLYAELKSREEAMPTVGIKELSRSSCRDPEVVAHPNHWDRNRMGGGYRSPRSWMISISTGTTTTPILDNTLVVTLTLSRSIILKSNSSTFTSLLLLCTEDSIWANLVIQHTS